MHRRMTASFSALRGTAPWARSILPGTKLATSPDVVGSDYAYPFSGVREVLEQDDFTFVNLECALTDYSVPG